MFDPPAIIAPSAQSRMTEKHYKQLYLTGSFNLWDHQPQYQLQRIDDKLYSATAILEQGSVNEFMFAAEDASKPYANCGYLNPSDQTVVLGNKVQASCSNVVLQNFVFIPPEPGVYEFFIDFKPKTYPRVFVHKAY